ncbi:tryptophan 7-halogenase [Sphingomonas sp. MMS24-JH45]
MPARDAGAPFCRRTAPDVDAASLSVRRLTFRSAHRDRFWGRQHDRDRRLSAGFLEPLEASAIVTIELALDHLVANFPATGASWLPTSAAFDAQARYRWDRIVEFLKLHYVLSRRTEPCWQAHRDPATIPPRLLALLDRWRHHPPSGVDLPEIEGIFPPPATSTSSTAWGSRHPRPARSPGQGRASRNNFAKTDKGRAASPPRSPPIAPISTP